MKCLSRIFMQFDSYLIFPIGEALRDFLVCKTIR